MSDSSCKKLCECAIKFLSTGNIEDNLLAWEKWFHECFGNCQLDLFLQVWSNVDENLEEVEHQDELYRVLNCLFDQETGQDSMCNLSNRAMFLYVKLEPIISLCLRRRERRRRRNRETLRPKRRQKSHPNFDEDSPTSHSEKKLSQTSGKNPSKKRYYYLNFIPKRYTNESRGPISLDTTFVARIDDPEDSVKTKNCSLQLAYFPFQNKVELQLHHFSERECSFFNYDWEQEKGNPLQVALWKNDCSTLLNELNIKKSDLQIKEQWKEYSVAYSCMQRKFTRINRSDGSFFMCFSGPASDDEVGESLPSTVDYIHSKKPPSNLKRQLSLRLLHYKRVRELYTKNKLSNFIFDGYMFDGGISIEEFQQRQQNNSKAEEKSKEGKLQFQSIMDSK